MKKILLCTLVFIFSNGTLLAQRKSKKEDPKKVELSEIHQRYAGKIVFSNSAITYGLEDTTKFLQTYNYGDSLFSRVYLERPVSEFVTTEHPAFANSDKSFSANVFLDGKFIHRKKFLTPELFTDSEVTSNTIFANCVVQMPLQKAEDKYFLPNVFFEFLDQISKTEQGEHTIKIELRAFIGSYGRELDPPIAVGELKMNFPKDDAKVSMLCLPPSLQNNPLLAERILQLYNKNPFDGTGETLVFVSKDWRYFRNEITSRIECRIADVVIGTRENGECYQIMYSFAEPFDGVNYQENGLFKYGSPGHRNSLPCNCLPEK